jgi:hypothetical protein
METLDTGAWLAREAEARHVINRLLNDPDLGVSGIIWKALLDNTPFNQGKARLIRKLLDVDSDEIVSSTAFRRDYAAALTATQPGNTENHIDSADDAGIPNLHHKLLSLRAHLFGDYFLLPCIHISYDQL